MKPLKFVLAILIVVSITVPLVLYFLAFGKNGISHKAGDWANFATFVSLFIGLCNLILFAFLTYYVQRYNESNDEQAEKRSRMLERPILSFSYFAREGVYFVENIGNGPAINIRIKTSLENGKWSYGFIWNSLRSASISEPMHWTKNTNVICAIYSDSFGHEYISYMENNHLITIDCSDKEQRKKYSKLIEKARIEISFTWRE